MLPKQNRLKNNQEIDQVFKKGKTARSGFLFLKTYANPERKGQPARIAFSIGLKFSRSAVERNRAKRVLRHAARGFVPSLKPGLDMVVFLKNAQAEDIDSRNIKQLFQRIFQQGLL